jgi:hypothetical protein
VQWIRAHQGAFDIPGATMEQARELQEKSLPQPERKQPQGEQEIRREPQPIDEELLRQIGGGNTEAPRGNW